MTPDTAPLVVAAGADVLVAGAAIFKGGSVESLPRQHRGDPVGVPTGRADAKRQS